MESSQKRGLEKLFPKRNQTKRRRWSDEIPRIRADERKLCVICSCAHLGSSYVDDFNIFIISCSDLLDSGVEKMEIKPNIRVRGFGGSSASFCYLNSESALYAFEDKKALVYKYALGAGDAAKSNYILEKSVLEKSAAPPMNTLKYQPRAIPTPDGKMLLVFSTQVLFYYPDLLIYDEPEYGCEDNVNHNHLELFDPATQSWKGLPQLMISSNKDDYYVVRDASGSWIELPYQYCPVYDYITEGYNCSVGSCFRVNDCSFLSCTTLLVHVTLQPGMGQFLTFDMDGGGLQPYQDWIPAAVDPHRFLVVRDSVYFSAFDGSICRTDPHLLHPYPPYPIESVEMEDVSALLHPYPLYPIESVEMEDVSAAMTLLDDSSLVRVRGGKHPKTWGSSLVVDVFSWDGMHLQCRASYHLLLGEISKSFGAVEAFLLP